MAAAIRLTRTGDARVLELTQVTEAAPGPGDVWLEQEAIGVNYLDAMQRNGAVPIPLPNGIGLEAAGRVAAIGPDVSNVAIGDRVAYALGPLGSYASHRIYPAARLVKLPDDISADDAASVVFKGITAQYLIKSTYAVGPGTVVLLYGVAGAVGQLLAPWAKHLGARRRVEASQRGTRTGRGLRSRSGLGRVRLASGSVPADRWPQGRRGL